MGKLSIVVLFLVSTPEAFLNLAVILLVADGKRYLELNRLNVIRYLSTAALMVLSSWYLRPLAPNVAINYLLHAAAYILIIMLVYRIRVNRSFLGVAILSLCVAAVESSYVPFVITYVSKGFENFLKDNMSIILFSIPERLFQIMAVRILWKYYILFEIVELNKTLSNLFNGCLLIFTAVEYYFSYIFTRHFDSMGLIHQILYSVSLLAMIAAFNCLVFKLFYQVTKGFLSYGFKRYKAIETGTDQAFKHIHFLLESNDREGAIEFLKKILGMEERGDKV